LVPARDAEPRKPCATKHDQARRLFNIDDSIPGREGYPPGLAGLGRGAPKLVSDPGIKVRGALPTDEMDRALLLVRHREIVGRGRAMMAGSGLVLFGAVLWSVWSVSAGAALPWASVGAVGAVSGLFLARGWSSSR